MFIPPLPVERAGTDHTFIGLGCLSLWATDPVGIVGELSIRRHQGWSCGQSHGLQIIKGFLRAAAPVGDLLLMASLERTMDSLKGSRDLAAWVWVSTSVGFHSCGAISICGHRRRR